MNPASREAGFGPGWSLWLALACVAFGALPAWAGDPVPDVDVILEQFPGGVISIEVRRPISYDANPIPDVDVILEQLPGFDGVRLSGDKALRDLTIKNLPPGWGLRRDGKQLVLDGPPVVPPVRFQLQVASARPSRFDVELMQAGKVRFAYSKIVPREVPQRVVAGTVKGTVRLPRQVSPGETIALRALPDAKLPPGGTWVISGTVSEPWDEDDLRNARAIVNTTRSQLKTRAVGANDRPIVLIGDGGCDGLAPVAATLQARTTDDGKETKHNTAEEGETRDDFEDDPADDPEGFSEAIVVTGTTAGPSEIAQPAHGKPPGKSRLLYLAELSPPPEARPQTLHDTAMAVIRNIRYAFAVATEPPPGIAIKEETMKARRGPSSAPVAPTKGRPGKREAWRADGGSTPQIVAWEWSDASAMAELASDQVTIASFDAEPIPKGCRFSPRDPNELEILRWARTQKPRPDGRPTGKPPKPEVYLAQLPLDLRPGDPISVQILDEWGDPWVDVAQVPDVEVVEGTPTPPGEDPRPRMDTASPYAVGGDQVCVCGSFQPTDIVAPFTIGGQPVQAVSMSRNIAWLQTPADRVGPSPVQAQGFAGEAATDLLRVRAELDQEHLFSGQSTPLRIIVEGTERAIALRMTNGTPQIIELEGGNQQNTETSGGALNTVTRQVRGLVRGSFQLGWEVRPPSCPCTGDGGVGG